jgi:hypothetical protein
MARQEITKADEKQIGQDTTKVVKINARETTSEADERKRIVEEEARQETGKTAVPTQEATTTATEIDKQPLNEIEQLIALGVSAVKNGEAETGLDLIEYAAMQGNLDAQWAMYKYAPESVKDWQCNDKIQVKRIYYWLAEAAYSGHKEAWDESQSGKISTLRFWLEKHELESLIHKNKAVGNEEKASYWQNVLNTRFDKRGEFLARRKVTFGRELTPEEQREEEYFALMDERAAKKWEIEEEQRQRAIKNASRRSYSNYSSSSPSSGPSAEQRATRERAEMEERSRHNIKNTGL